MGEKPIMMCNHIANGINSKTGEPVCVICNESRTRIDAVSLSNREAVCVGCKYEKPTRANSSVDLPFFKYRPDEETDSYYCGCWGWD